MKTKKMMDEHKQIIREERLTEYRRKFELIEEARREYKSWMYISTTLAAGLLSAFAIYEKILIGNHIFILSLLIPISIIFYIIFINPNQNFKEFNVEDKDFSSLDSMYKEYIGTYAYFISYNSKSRDMLKQKSKVVAFSTFIISLQLIINSLRKDEIIFLIFLLVYIFSIVALYGRFKKLEGERKKLSEEKDDFMPEW